MSTCDTTWGSHACDLETGHFGVCECNYGQSGPCSQYDPFSKRVRHADLANPRGVHSWTQWMEVGA